jgi:glycosyltransferase involved in cell wall biosynthesis
MRVGIIPDEINMPSVRSVFRMLEETLARRHEIVHRPLEYFFYASESKQKVMSEEFVRQCDLIAGRIDDKVFAAREQLERKPPIIGFLMGTMSRGAAEVAGWSRYLRSKDILIGNCEGDLGITRKFFNDKAQLRKLAFSFDETVFCPVDEQRRQAIRAEMRFKPTDKILLYSGRISLEKNVQSLIRVFSVLQDLVPDIHLVVVGGPFIVQFPAMGVFPLSSTGTLTRVMDELQVKQSQVHFIGGRGPAQLRELYAMADILLNFTLHHDENFGLAQIEAMACGTPVVGTSWGGLKDTIKDGVSGYQISTVVTDGGVKLNWWEAINRIIELLEDEEKLARFRETARAYALELSSYATYVETLESIVAECEQAGYGPSELVKTTEFARDYWLETLPNEFSPPSFQRGQKSFEMYKELITPYTGVTENTIPLGEPLTPEQLLVLASPVRIEGNVIRIDDPIFPLEFVMPEENQKTAEAIFAVLRTQPVISVESLQQRIPAPVQSCFQTTVRWMLAKGMLLRSKLMDNYIEPDMIGEQMGKPVFSIQPVDYTSDVVVVRKSSAAQTYAAS